MAKFILSKEKLMQNLKEWKKEADILSYSIKTNPFVAKLLKNKKIMFSAHTLKEAKEINAKKIIFFLQGNKLEEIKKIWKKGIRWFVVDNERDLDNLEKIIEKKETNLLLRIKMREKTVFTERYFVFGFDSEKAKEVVSQLEGYKSLGIHYHKKTQNLAEWDYLEELKETYGRNFWKKIKYLNMGGGIPSIYKNTEPKSILEIKRKIREIRKWANKKNIKLIIEPGRAISASCIKLETEIINKYGRNLIIDASLYNAYLDTLIYLNRLLVEGEAKKGKAWLIKGNSPCSLDIFRYKVYLKKEPEIGDKIVFLNAGAYNFYSEFAGLDKIKTIVKKDF